jgi:hypothetical protein
MRIKEIGEHFAGSASESILSEATTLEEKCDRAIVQLDSTTRDVEMELERADEEQRRRFGLLPRSVADPIGGDARA